MPDDENERTDDETEDTAESENLDGQLQFTVVSDSDKQNKSTISSDLIRGHINTIILRTLDERDKYGYEIMDEIQRKSLGQYELKQPTLYSALKRLEKQGYITAYWKTDEVSLGGRRKYFTLTELGREFTDQNRKEWEYTRTVIDTLISDQPFDFSEPAPGKVDFSVLKKATTRLPNFNGKNGETEDEEDAVAPDEQIEIEDAEDLPTEDAETAAEDEVDPIYIEVLKFCVEDEYASVPAIQKKFSLSFTQSLAILDWMEKMNYVAPPQGSKPQDVLLSKNGFTALYGGQFEDETENEETAEEKSSETETSEEANDGQLTEDISEEPDEESDEETGETEEIASEENDESEPVVVEEEPAPDKVTMIEDGAPQEDSAKIDAEEIKEWIKSAITDALGDIMKDDEEDAVVDGEITDISSGIDTSEDNPELDTSLFETSAEKSEPDEYFEPQQIDIAELIKGVVHEVLEQEGATQPAQPQYQQPIPTEYIQPAVPSQYTEPVPPQYQQPVQPEYTQPPILPQYPELAPQYTESVPPQYQQTTQTDYVQQESLETNEYRQTIIEQSPLYAVNPTTPEPSQQELEKEKEKEKVHENFMNFINQAPSGTNEDVNPATQNLDTDELIYTNKSEAERNYTDIIYGMYDQTVGYRQRPPEPQSQPQPQPVQEPVQQRPRPAYITRKADEDGLKVYTAEEQADSNVKHSGPYNVGITVFKASILPAVYLIILAVMGFVFSDRLAVNYVYGSVYLIVGVLLFIVCALFALTGYRSHAVRPITHGYVSITIVLTIIAILFICILGIALDAYTETAPIIADVVLPSLAMLAAPMYVVGFYLMSQSKKISE